MLIKNNFNLKAFNTFGLSVISKQLAIIEKRSDLSELFSDGLLHQRDILVLGEGSNILFANDVEGLVLINKISGIEIEKEEDDFIYLRIGSGENWSSLVDFAVANGWGGIENLSLIPGTVGAAPIQNIGAYGCELKETLESLDAFDLINGSTQSFQNNECEFSYRSSVFKTRYRGRFFILSILLKLSKKPQFNLSYGPLKKAFENRPVERISLQEVSEEVKSVRNSKLPDPQDLGNAGSFFKNPVIPFSRVRELQKRYPDMPFYHVDESNSKLAAGWLIEKAGWKGKKIGDAGMHEKQALVLVNYGNATGKELVSFSRMVQKSVHEKFGISLIPEVTII